MAPKIIKYERGVESDPPVEEEAATAAPNVIRYDDLRFREDGGQTLPDSQPAASQPVWRPKDARTPHPYGGYIPTVDELKASEEWLNAGLKDKVESIVKLKKKRGLLPQDYIPRFKDVVEAFTGIPNSRLSRRDIEIPSYGELAKNPQFLAAPRAFQQKATEAHKDAILGALAAGDTSEFFKNAWRWLPQEVFALLPDFMEPKTYNHEPPLYHPYLQQVGLAKKGELLPEDAAKNAISNYELIMEQNSAYPTSNLETLLAAVMSLPLLPLAAIRKYDDDEMQDPNDRSAITKLVDYLFDNSNLARNAFEAVGIERPKNPADDWARDMLMKIKSEDE